MSENNKVQVTIDGKKLTLVGPESAEYMSDVAEYITERINEVRSGVNSKYLNPILILTLAAVNVADNYFKEISNNKKLSSDLVSKSIAINDSEKLLTQAENFSKGLKNINMELEEKIQILNKNINELNSEITVHKQTGENAKSKIEELQFEKYNFEKEINDLISNNNKTKSDYEKIKTDSYEYFNKINELKLEKSELESSLEANKIEYSKLVSRFEANKSEKERIEKVLENAQEEKFELQALLDSYKAEHSLKLVDINNLTDENSILKIELEKMKEELRISKEDNRDIQLKTEELTLKNKELVEQNDSLEQKVSSFQEPKRLSYRISHKKLGKK